MFNLTDIQKAIEFNNLIFSLLHSQILMIIMELRLTKYSLIENLEYIVLIEEEVEDVLRIINRSKT